MAGDILWHWGKTLVAEPEALSWCTRYRGRGLGWFDLEDWRMVVEETKNVVEGGA